MRAIKTTTISILAVGLLAGSAVGVTAQDEALDSMEPAVFVYEVVDGTEAGFSIEASDPRATGFVTTPLHDRQLDLGGQGYALALGAGEATLTTDGGTWSGTTEEIEARKFLAPQVDRGIWIAKLDGEGALEGLSMTLFSIGLGGDERPEAWGYIYPTDPVTPAE